MTERKENAIHSWKKCHSNAFFSLCLYCGTFSLGSARGNQQTKNGKCVKGQKMGLRRFLYCVGLQKERKLDGSSMTTH